MPTIQYINTGSGANAGDGDSLRSAFIKVNNNFSNINSIIADNLLPLTTIGQTPPDTYRPGYLWYNTTVGKIFIWDGSNWNDTAFYMPTYTLPTLDNTIAGQVLTVSNYGLPIWKTPTGGTGGSSNTGTIWTNDANGCLRAELSSTGFEAFTDATHLDLQDSGRWNIGSYQNSTVIGNDEFTNTNILSLRSGDDTYITTNLRENGNHQWKFGADGNLTLPSGNTRIGDVNGSDAIVSNTGTAFGVVTQGTGGYVALEWVDNIENLGTTSTQVASVVVNSPIASTTGTVQILTGITTGTDIGSNIWEFGATGTLTIPDDIQDANGSVVRVATTSTAPTRVEGQLWFNTDDGRGYIRYDNTWMDLSPTEVPPPSTYLDGLTIDGTTISAIDSTATVSIESGSNMWDFSSTGTLTLPNGSTIGSAEYFSGIPLTTERGTILFGNSPPIGFSSHFHIMKEDPTNVDLFLGDDTNFVKLPTTGGVEITSENTSTWTFGADGFLTFPDSNLQIGELFGLVGMLGGTDAIVGILGQGNSGSVGLEWVDDLTSPTSIAAVLLNNYQSGSVQIQTGIPAGPSASNVWEFVSDGRTSFPNYTFQAGDGTAGQVLVTNGSGSVTWTTPIAATGNANTGDFTFTATTLSAATNQSVVLHTNANDWIFGSTGTLTVPGNIIPDVDSIYSLGSPTRKFKDLYVSTTTIYMGDLVISGSPSTGLTINGNSANSKQTFVGGEGVGPDNCSWIEWAIGTNYLTVRNPGTNFKLIMEGLKTGNTFNAVSPIDLTFTVSSTLWHFDNELTPDNPEYRIGVNETNVSFSGEFIYLLAVPVPERTNALSNGIYSLTLDSTGTVTLPGNLILPAGGDIRDTTSNISVLKTRIGDTYASGAFQQLTIAHDEGKLITIAGGNSVFRLPQMTADMLGAEFEFYFSGDAGQIHIQSYYTGVRATTDIFRGSIYVGVDNATTGKLHKATATTATACDLFLGQHHAKVGSYVKVKAIAFNTVGIWMFQGMCVGDTGQTPNSSDHPFQDYN